MNAEGSAPFSEWEGITQPALQIVGIMTTSPAHGIYMPAPERPASHQALAHGDLACPSFLGNAVPPRGLEGAKMANKNRFVGEIALSLTERLSDALSVAGLTTDAPWVAVALVSTGCVPGDDDAIDVLDRILADAFRGWKHFDDKHATVLKLIQALRSFSGFPRPLYSRSAKREDWDVKRDSCKHFVRECDNNGVDFAKALESIAKTGQSGPGAAGNRAFELRSMAEYLCEAEVLDPRRLFESAKLVANAKAFGWWGGGSSSQQVDEECCDPTSPTFWLNIGLEPFLKCMRAVFADASDEDAADFATGVVSTLRRAGVQTIRDNDYSAPGRIRRAVFQELDKRVGTRPREANASLRKVWLRLANEVPDKYVSELGPDRPRCLVAGADFELGQWRARIKKTSSENATNVFSEEFPWMNACADVLFSQTSPWSALRALLLVFRNLNQLAVKADVSYWERGEVDSDVPAPWNQLPEAIVGVFHAGASQEQEKDADLSRMRTELCRFCLERLKSTEPGGPPKEPNPDWRLAYIWAARELRMNPDGSGHRVLHYVAEKDPDAEVARFAREVYDEMRHRPSLPDGMSPRRAISNALIWLFQAHYLTLAPDDQPLDTRGVQRTRDTIARRTAEPRKHSGPIDGGVSPL